MKIKHIYICEVCGKESENSKEIRAHEASHFNLTSDEKIEWDFLK